MAFHLCLLYVQFLPKALFIFACSSLILFLWFFIYAYNACNFCLRLFPSFILGFPELDHCECMEDGFVYKMHYT
jgi:hypothetical protein